MPCSKDPVFVGGGPYFFQLCQSPMGILIQDKVLKNLFDYRSKIIFSLLFRVLVRKKWVFKPGLSRGFNKGTFIKKWTG